MVVNRQKRVLLIDDERLILDIYKAFLEEHDVVVDICESGLEAVNYVTNNKYNLIICDMLMPGKSGLNTVNAIVKVDPKVKVLIITGYEQTAYLRGHANIVDVLSKSCHLKEILVYI